MQKRNLNKSRFATLLKSHSCTDMPRKIRSTSAEHSYPAEQLRGTASARQKKFKRQFFSPFWIMCYFKQLQCLTIRHQALI